MSLRKEYKHVKKLSAGPGGWSCPCCNPMGCSPRKMKVRARRMLRHISKQNVETP